jgi:AraC-like DNA-binding protein
VFVDAARR